MYILVMPQYQSGYPLSSTAYFDPAGTPLGRISYAGHHLDVIMTKHMRMREWNTYSLVYVRNGNARFRDVEGKDIPVGGGDVMLMFPLHGYRYLVDPGTPWSEAFVQFSGPIFDLWHSNGLITPDDPVWHLEPVSYWWPRIEAVVAAQHAGARDSALGRICLLQSFLADGYASAHRPAAEQAKRDWVAQAEALLQEELGAYPDWNALSGRLGMSYERFRKRFRELAGVSPARYRAIRRVAWAAELLGKRGHSLDHVAATCGYHDKFHFIKRFKAATGLTPTQYRRRMYS